MMNIINGGAHADNPIDIQEFMIMPVGAPTVRRGAAHGRGGLPRAEEPAQGRRPQHRVGDEGGFAPNLDIGRRGAGLHHEGDRAGGLQAGRGRRAGARSRPRPSSSRRASTSSKARARSLDAGRHGRLLRRPGRSAIPIVSIEDGCAEDDWDGWKVLTDKLGEKMPAGGRRPLRHQPRAAGAGHRARAWPMRSW